VPGLRIGILADTLLKQQYLANVVMQAGHEIGYSCVIDTAAPFLAASISIDVWVIDLAEAIDSSGPDSNKQTAVMALLEELLEQTDIPVIVNEDIEFKKDSADHNHWIRRMLLRLERLSGDINLQHASSANEVWVLAASTGGPAAVKEFIKHLPAHLDIAFLYVQHIDSGQAEPLVKLMSNAGHYPGRVAKQGIVLTNNTLTLITAGPSVNIHDNGTLVFSKKPWGGCYSPSIDQVAANVARVYRKRCGMIIFSGLGNDGTASGKLMKQLGGLVWVQTPANCTSASMPDAALAAEIVSLVGTPQELALALSAHKNRPKVGVAQ
jgi:chemosensory pili system protein ChpB (putative protein-glutamate methylesterase)